MSTPEFSFDIERIQEAEGVSISISHGFSRITALLELGIFSIEEFQIDIDDNISVMSRALLRQSIQVARDEEADIIVTEIYSTSQIRMYKEVFGNEAVSPAGIEYPDDPGTGEVQVVAYLDYVVKQ